MKIEPRRIAAVLRDPTGFRVILLYGEDHGLARERASNLTKQTAGTLDDPFRVAVLEPQDHAKLAEEATALSLTGGNRVVCVRDADDKLTVPLTKLLEGKTSALVILEAAGLDTRSKLRAFAEKHTEVAAIACYPEDGAALAGTIQSILGEDKISLAPEALTYLTGVLGADRIATRSEIGKLALYAGPGSHISLEDAEAAVGDTADLGIDDALYAATASDNAAADRAISLALNEGAAGVQIIRTALAHLQRLLRAKLAMQPGQSAEEAARGLRPPLYFKRVPQFAKALNQFSAKSLLATSNRLLELERLCKSNGIPDDTIGRFAIILLLRAARGRG